MRDQLWPLYIIAAVFGLYTLKAIVVYLWDESLRIAAENAQYRKETHEGKDNA